ncbi:MAG: YtxH domain-containing protein [Ferruginibacter sp.]
MTTVNKLMIGVAAGAILGILYAPDKGSITRRKLSRTGNDIRDKFNDIRDTITDKIDSLRSDVNDIAYEETTAVENEASIAPPSWK